MRYIFALILALATAVPALAGDPIWSYEEGDPAMGAAIADARRTLPIFYDKFAVTDVTKETVLLKVAMPYDDRGTRSYEHIWVAVRSRDGDRFEGVFANEPVYIDYEQYDPISFTEADISDWSFWDESGKMQGAFTIRVMLPNLPVGTAEEYRAILAPLPEGTGQGG